MISCIKGSEPEVLSTGDQSLAEVLSDDTKVITYEEQPWKKELAKGVFGLAEEGSKLAQYYQNVHMIVGRQGRQSGKLKSEKIHANAQYYLQNMTEIRAQSAQVHRKIVKNYNLKKNFLSKVRRGLIVSQSPEFHARKELFYSKFPSLRYIEIFRRNISGQNPDADLRKQLNSLMKSLKILEPSSLRNYILSQITALENKGVTEVKIMDFFRSVRTRLAYETLPPRKRSLTSRIASGVRKVFSRS